MTLRFRDPVLAGIARRLPPLEGHPIRVRFLPELTARGHLVESRTGRGREVHAASFLRKREMVLDRALLAKRRELARIFVHELFHFAWIRLGNGVRGEWERLIAAEMASHARGELGWSAERLKEGLSAADACNRTRAWREYICESYCDTAAWSFAGLRGHGEFTLARRFCSRRRGWFEEILSRGPILL